MLPTDRGYVLIESDTGVFNLRIFAMKDDSGALAGEYAVHAGLAQSEFTVEVPVQPSDAGDVTASPAEVFLSDTDGLVHVQSITVPGSFPALESE